MIFFALLSLLFPVTLIPNLKFGGEIEQIQFLLGHVSVQTTERYLGCKQRLRDAVNDSIGIEPEAAAQA